ncbi:MAG TPA: HDIG domain-containing protein [Bacteroidota bacterium]|nr:HDIG domain-containing protein [Bacteroidota bacterium]
MLKIFQYLDNKLNSEEFKNNKIFSLIILALLIFLIVSMFPVGKSIEYEYNLGAIWTYDDLIASFTFPIFRDEADYKSEVEKVENSFLPIFKVTKSSTSNDSSKTFFDSLEISILYRMNGNAFKMKYDTLLPIQFIQRYSDRFSYNDWQNLINLKKRDYIKNKDSLNFTFFKKIFLETQNNYTEKNILSIPKSNIKSEEISVRENNIEKIYSKTLFYDVPEIKEIIKNNFYNSYPDTENYSELINKISEIVFKPGLIFDYDATQREKNILIESVPRTLGIVKENEKIISNGEKITYETKLKIDSYRKAKAERTGKINTTLQYIGKASHTFVMLLLFLIYLYLFRKKIFDDNLMLLLITFLILFISFLAYLSMQIKTNEPIQYLIILPVSSMLLTIIFDSRVGFYSTVTTSLIVSAIRGNDYSIFLASLVAGSLAVYTVRDIKNRNQIFRSILFIMIGYSISIISIGLERFDNYKTILEQLLYAGINSIFSPVLTFGFLIFFERVFRISTDVTLLELSDFNHPLLKELSSKAPGTFHHSVVIGSLAEAAAESIGANSLLARVGAYYHDIGKILKPEYFIENQVGGKNKHDKLTPHMSTLIIISHVKEGIDLAKKYKLPQMVIDFIPMHHGTTLVKFFYEKALRRRKTSKDQIREIDFKYPGPKPNTKETGIVMLADSVEASVRAMVEPTVPQMEGLIDSLIKSRLLEGELDNCNLTMQEIAKIKSSFLKIFVGIHHKRLKYPESQDQNKPATQ